MDPEIVNVFVIPNNLGDSIDNQARGLISAAAIP